MYGVFDWMVFDGDVFFFERNLFLYGMFCYVGVDVDVVMVDFVFVYM